MRCVRFFLWWVLGTVLTGCLSVPPAKVPDVVVSAERVAVEQPALPFVRTPPEPAYQPSSLSVPEIQKVLRLLDEAEQAMAKQQYTTPEGRSALARYQAVLALIPEHQEAQQGLSKIANRYLDWADAALNRGDRGAARNYLSRAKLAVETNPRMDAIEAALATPIVSQPAAVTTQPPSDNPRTKVSDRLVISVSPSTSEPTSTPTVVEKGGPREAFESEVLALSVPPSDPAEAPPPFAEDLKTWEVDAVALQQRDTRLQLQLAGLADLIESRRSRVTIQAPSDADGRWLYQQLNERRLEYRIRANFERAKFSRIILLD